MNILLIESFHAIIATTLVGLTIANYFYCFINFNNPQLAFFIFRISRLSDIFVIIPLIFLTLITGIVLINSYHFSFNLFWIQSTLTLLGIIFLLQIALLFLKKQQAGQFKTLFHCIYCLQIIGYVIIVHNVTFQKAFIFS